MMRRVIGICLITILSFSWVVPVIAQEDTVSMLGVRGVLSDGTLLQGALEGSDSMHLYAFEGEKGIEVALRMTQSKGSIDPLLILLNQDGSLLAWDDDSAENLNAQILSTLPNTGVYFVLATTLSALYQAGDENEIKGSYSLEIRGASNPSAEIDLDLSGQTIQALALDTTQRALIDEDNPLFFAILTVQDSIIVDLRADSNEVDTLMYVFDIEGQRIAIDDDGGSDGHSAYVPALSLSEPGQYLVVVTSFDYHTANERGLEGGTFNLTVSRSPTG